MNRLCFSWLAVVAVACSLFARSIRAAEPPVARAALEPKIAELVALVSDGRVDAMLARIGPIPEHEHDAFEEQRQHLVNLYSNAGKYSGFDVAGYKVVTPRFQIAYVVVNFEKRPVLFEFGFYEVDEKWRPLTLHVETDFKVLVDTVPFQR